MILEQAIMGVEHSRDLRQRDDNGLQFSLGSRQIWPTQSLAHAAMCIWGVLDTERRCT